MTEDDGAGIVASDGAKEEDPTGVIHAAVGLHTPQECAQPLGEVLRHGPLFYSPQGFGDEGSYTALLPAPYATEPVGGGGPWWVLPCDDPSWLCPAELVATLAVLGRDVLSGLGGSRGA